MTAAAQLPAIEEPAPRRLAYRDAGGRWRSEGQRLLSVVKGTDKNLTIAAQLEISERYAAMLLIGDRQPSCEVIARAWMLWRIPGEAWGLAPLELSVPRIP